ALHQLQKLGIWGQELPVVPVHTPLADSFTARLRSVLAGVPFQTPEYPVYCGMSAQPYPAEPEEIRRLLLESISKPVHIRETISQLYRDGVRIFLQLGGGGKLLTNIQSTLALHPHIALSIDREHRGGLEQFQHVVGRLAVMGVALNPVALYRNRVCTEIDPQSPTPPKPGRLLSLTPPRLRPSDETVREIRALMGAPQARPAHAVREPEGSLAYAPPAPGLRGAPGPLAEVMSTLDRFLELQRQEEEAEAQVFARFLETQQAAVMALANATRPAPAAVADAPVAPPAAKPVPAHPHPLIGEIQRWVPGKEFESRLVLDLDAHPFLAHHALIRVPDSLRPLEERLPTLPMTFEAEILAEAAALLAPEMTLVCCHDLEAARWVSLEDSRQLPLNILGRRISSSEVEVELRTPGSDRPAFRGKATVGSTPAMAPPPMEIRLDRPCPTTAADFYAHGPLFHGPMFHVITALNGMSEDAIAAELRVSDPRQLFAAPTAEAPVFDPVLLDALGQVVAYRTLLEDWAVFPLKVGRIWRYRPTPAAGSSARVHIRYQKLDARRLTADMDVFDESGNLWLRIEGWQVWRILWPKGLLEFSYHAREGRLAEPWPTRNPSASCFRVRRDGLGDISPDWIARLYLRGGEWARYRQQPRLDWLLGRIAAKDALRDWLRRHRGKTLHPLEIEIGNLPSGAPVLLSPQEEGLALSVSHIEDAALAVASGARGAGADLARVMERSSEFRELAFDPQERAALAECPGDPLAWLHRAWCAKEAAAKAYGVGFDALPQFRVRSLHPDDESVEVEFLSEGNLLRVQTWLEGDCALAVVELS
ncbi:MAG: polyketide synthase dehydratase domain-containing protein, partial [Terriglobales bacterium]